MFFLLFLISLGVGVYCQGGPPDADTGVTFVLNPVSNIYMCSDEVSQGFMNASKVNTVRWNETVSYIGGNLIFYESFNHETMMEIVLEKEANGRYEMMMSLEICDICNEIEDPDSPYTGYIGYFGLPKTCPFEPGEYPINDLVADTQDLPINSANAGAYLVTMNLYKDPSRECTGDRTFLACMKLDCVIEPL